MSAKTSQTVRPLLRSIQKTFARSTAGDGFVCSQCRYRGLSAWDKQASRQYDHARLSNKGQWTRSWSSFAARQSPSERDKPSDLFHMPPPASHVEDVGPDDSLRKPPPSSHAEADSSASSARAAESIAMPPPTSEQNQQPELPSDSIPDIPPTRPSPVGEPSMNKHPEPIESPPDPLETPASQAEPRSIPSGDAGHVFTSSPAKNLPSDTEKGRWQLSKNMQAWMDDFLAKAAIFSQQLNTYTGTDYSGIVSLRQEIIEQERDVKKRHAAIATAKEAYSQAQMAQTASQKEVVGLLERKHSWSAGDLERYMSLIRSEHLNEQAVQRAKEELASAERSLEDARSTLERKERKQYHEEQIWSDTIRRNSTWVTFGLMGLNIVLLLANLAIIEPWRRRRLVKEVRTALEENSIATTASITAATAQAPTAKQMVEEQVEEVMEFAGSALEKVEERVEDLGQSALEAVVAIDDEEAPVGETTLAAGEVLPDEAVEVVPSDTVESAIEEVPEPPKAFNLQTLQKDVKKGWEQLRAVVLDMFSERVVTLKKVDVTTVALEGAAAGIAVMGFLVLIFNPR